MLIVYIRPFPFGARSARRLTVSGPVITQSGLLSPFPVPLIGSLLVTEVILQATDGSQLSVADTLTITGTI